MRRILFEKTGNAVYISHLDLMRLFQRAFKRGGLNLKHTQGFSPRAMVSIALPLSVGVESRCEILDYELVGQEELTCEEIRERLNRTIAEPFPLHKGDTIDVRVVRISGELTISIGEKDREPII